MSEHNMDRQFVPGQINFHRCDDLIVLSGPDDVICKLEVDPDDGADGSYFSLMLEAAPETERRLDLAKKELTRFKDSLAQKDEEIERLKAIVAAITDDDYHPEELGASLKVKTQIHLQTTGVGGKFFRVPRSRTDP